MTQFNYTNFIQELHEFILSLTFNSCNSCFIIRVIIIVRQFIANIALVLGRMQVEKTEGVFLNLCAAKNQAALTGLNSK